MFEYKNNSNKIKSILTSKFKRVNLKLFTKLNLFFLVKQQTKNKVLFLILMVYLMFGEFPKIFVKKYKKQKAQVVSFRYVLPTIFFYKFIVLQLSYLDTINNITNKLNGTEINLVFCDIPIISEIDLLCEKHNSFLEYIKNYKLVLNTHLNWHNEHLWYYVECILRLHKVPFKEGNR